MKIRSEIFILSLLSVVFVLALCPDASAAVFDSLAVKTGQFADGMRKLAYAISGFGIIMFTFLAICGKINFKHLGYIMISLFFLSGVGALITYIKGGDTRELVYTFQDSYVSAISPNAGRMR